MAAAPLQPLRENAGLAFLGEPHWRSGTLQPGQARTLWTGSTSNGRPYGEVLRCFLGVGAAGMVEHWQVDFPPHFTEQEVRLYPDPVNLLEGRRSAPPNLPWWRNPYCNPDLRAALARLDRYCATPVAWPAPHWSWVETSWLPDDTLLAVARDDDFTLGVLRSRFFSAWWEGAGPDRKGPSVVEAFSFPWPPATALSALTGIQQDLRFAIGRAARAENQEEIDRQVATAYGWPADLAAADVVQRLVTLNRRRA